MKMLFPVALATALAAMSLPSATLAQAGAQLVLPLGGSADIRTVAYRCGDEETPLDVTYIDAHPNYLAILPVEYDGALRDTIFVAVPGSEDVRYVSGEHVWLTRDVDAALAVQPPGADMLILTDCFEVMNTP